MNCKYSLRGLQTYRCPECGRPFDPREPLSMDLGRPLERWAVRWLGPTGKWTTAWAMAATISLAVVGQLDPFSVLADFCSKLHLCVPGGLRAGSWYSALSEWPIWMWIGLLIVWEVRTIMRRLAVRICRQDPVLLRADDRRQRFAARLLLVSLLVGGARSDQCPHARYWQMWNWIGIARSQVGGPCLNHASSSAHLVGEWYVYNPVPWFALLIPLCAGAGALVGSMSGAFCRCLRWKRKAG